MVASIGPFWDANETWLVLGVGILLVAFPAGARRRAAATLPAGGADAGRPDRCAASRSTSASRRATATRRPVEPRCSSPARCSPRWRRAGCSAATSAASAAAGTTRCSPPPSPSRCRWPTCCWAPCWLVMKTEGELQEQACSWAKHRLAADGRRHGADLDGHALDQRRPCATRWFALPEIIALSAIPLTTGVRAAGGARRC